MPLPNTFGAASARGFGAFSFQTPSDPNFSSVSLLLPGNGTNGAQNNTFVDSSTNNFTITRNGNTTQGTFSPFPLAAGSAWSAATNGGSGYFDGSGDWLSVPDNSAFDLGAGAFTLECFAYLKARASGYDTLIGQWDNSSDSWILLLTGNTIQFYGNGVLAKSESVTITTGQWYHFACTRDFSNNLRLYANGVKLGSDTAYSTTLINSTASPSIGCRGDGLSTTNFNGYLSSVRVIKGSAEYTGSTYTVPTAPLTAITNTSLLLNFTNGAIYDAAAKNDLETIGNAQISTTQSKWGGSSMYFDGTGDWLLGAQNANLSANSDFTVEVWGYIVSGSQTIATYANTSGQTQWRLRVVGGKAEFEWVNNTLTVFAATGTSTIATGQWIYLAATLSGTTLRIFVNGTLEASTTVSGTARNQANPAFFVGQDGIGASNFNGYLQDLRITKGVARYTSNFTPPTAPFPVR